jgi:hypothetical protein
MSNKRYETWYFYDYCEKFIKELDFVYDTYVKYIKNIFESPNIEAEKYEV